MVDASFQMSSLNTPELTKKNIRDQVYDILRDRMHHGQINFEDRLVDHEIAAELNVSRMPVREALLQLKNEGYLEGTTRGFVLPQFTADDIANMFEIRLLLEPSAAASSCTNATIEGLGKMKLAAEAADRAHKKGDVLSYMHSNWSFRATWVEMVPNRHLIQIINRLRDHAQTVRLATLKDKEFRALSLKNTHAILDAFINKDPQTTQERVAHNLRMSAASYYATQESEMNAESSVLMSTPPKSSIRNRTKVRKHV